MSAKVLELDARIERAWVRTIDDAVKLHKQAFPYYEWARFYHHWRASNAAEQLLMHRHWVTWEKTLAKYGITDAPAVSTHRERPVIATTAGALLPSGDEVHSYMTRVNGAVDSLGADILPSAASLEFKNAWFRWVLTWKEFWEEHNDSIWMVGLYDEIERYDQELLNWREAFKAQGGTPTAPPPVKPGAGPLDDLGKGLDSLATFGTAAAILGAIAVTVYVVHSIK